jgi:hypothetical protein
MFLCDRSLHHRRLAKEFGMTYMHTQSKEVMNCVRKKVDTDKLESR